MTNMETKGGFPIILFEAGKRKREKSSNLSFQRKNPLSFFSQGRVELSLAFSFEIAGKRLDKRL